GRESLQRTVDVLFADEEIDVVVTGLPAVRVHREAAPEGERDLRPLEDGGHALEGAQEALLVTLGHADLPWKPVASPVSIPVALLRVPRGHRFTRHRPGAAVAAQL